MPAELRPAVAKSLSDFQTTVLEDDDDALEDDLLASAHPADSVLQVKIALADVRPAVWRRLLIEADASLGELHDVIQRSFDWDDSQLHRFTLDGWYSAGPSFGPIADGRVHDADGDEYDEDVIAIGALLRSANDHLFYLYDFGDDWRHTILLEAVHPPGFATAPTCLAGRGAAREDDSGGAAGWAQRQRAGAAAAPFDIERVNTRLAPLREIH